MESTLSSLLENLHSDENRLAFLKKLYKPGNTEVADRILDIDGGDSSIVEKEMKYAQKSGDINRFKAMAKRCIDYHVSEGYSISLKDRVIGWQDPELADYAIARMISKPRKERELEGPLGYSAEIAQAFGKSDVARTNLERLLTLQKRDSKYVFTAAETLAKLGRFNEAIDRYLSGKDYYLLKDAMRLAKEHSPERVLGIAKRGFNPEGINNGFSDFYVECAQELGKKDEAERTLVNHARGVKVENSPRFYGTLVKTLVSLGQNKVAAQLVSRIAKHEQDEKSNGSGYYDFDRPEEMAHLYHAVGEIDAVKKIYAERIEAGIRKKHHPSNTMHDIEKAIELTGDKAMFLGKKLILHEVQGEYRQAALLALELGKPELAESYKAMDQMVSASA